MKFQFSALFLVLSATATNAFAPTAFSNTQLVTRLAADSAAAIKEAEAASKEFGADSPQARAAWDVVEEIDASNSHSAAATVTKMPVPEPVTSSGVDIDGMEQKRADALAEAKRLTEEKGAASPEARVAWELVEELGATSAHHKVTGSG